MKREKAPNGHFVTTCPIRNLTYRSRDRLILNKDLARMNTLQCMAGVNTSEVFRKERIIYIIKYKMPSIYIFTSHLLNLST